jgi:hypothetical protein
MEPTGLVNQAVVAHEDLLWFFAHRRVSFVIAPAVDGSWHRGYPRGGGG